MTLGTPEVVRSLCCPKVPYKLPQVLSGSEVEALLCAVRSPEYPGALRPVALRNRRVFYETLFEAATQTLLTLGRDPKRYGAILGVTAVLHTWTRGLQFHPHLHCVVTGGGLRLDGNDWVDAPRRFLFPVKVLGALFRGKFLDALRRAHGREPLDLPPELSAIGAFDDLCTQLYRKIWVVFVRRPFAGPEQVYSYLGRYTHRVAISNHRLLDVTGERVTIATRDGKTESMKPRELIRRFLLHVLPDGFVKIRHYGLVASSNLRTRFETARSLLAGRIPQKKPAQARTTHDARHETWEDTLERLTGIDIRVCPACGSHRRTRRPLPARTRRPLPAIRRGTRTDAPRGPPETRCTGP